MVTQYFWNVALCQTLYQCLSALEIAMRNGLHNALTTHFTVPSASASPPPWFDIPGLLLPREQSQIDEVKRQIRNAKKPVTPPRIIAGLSYGFWTSILDSGYGNTLWSATNPATLVQQAFPYAPLHFQVRSRVHNRFNRIRVLRNRVSHHEPIWHGIRLPDGELIPLVTLHFEIIDAIGWVAPTLQSTVVALDQFPMVNQDGRAIIRDEIKQHLGIL